MNKKNLFLLDLETKVSRLEVSAFVNTDNTKFDPIYCPKKTIYLAGVEIQ